MSDGAHIAPIDRFLLTGAEPELVWRTLTEPARVTLWFTEASRLGRVGDPYRLDFGDGSIVSGEVLTLDPGRAFSYSWAWEDAGPHEVTRVAWAIEPHLGGSRVRLLHDGWAEAGLDVATRDDHDRYWANYLDDLRDVLEEA